MLTYNSILSVLVAEGLVKSYVIPKTLNQYKLNETFTFLLLLALLAISSVVEFFVLSKCINSESMTNAFKNTSASAILLLIGITLAVNYMWIFAIYDKFQFWRTIGILSVVSFVNEIDSSMINSLLKSITGTECNLN